MHIDMYKCTGWDKRNPRVLIKDAHRTLKYVTFYS